MKKNSQERVLLKPEEIEAGFYIVADDDNRDDRTGYFIAEVVGTFIKARTTENFLVKSKASALDLWYTHVGNTTVVHIDYFVRKATELEKALA